MGGDTIRLTAILFHFLKWTQFLMILGAPNYVFMPRHRDAHQQFGTAKRLSRIVDECKGEILIALAS